MRNFWYRCDENAIDVQYYMYMYLFPDDMIDAWLKMKDDVFMVSGEPTCDSLVVALKKIGQNSMADEIVGKPAIMDHSQAFIIP